MKYRTSQNLMLKYFALVSWDPCGDREFLHISCLKKMIELPPLAPSWFRLNMEGYRWHNGCPWTWAWCCGMVWAQWVNRPCPDCRVHWTSCRSKHSVFDVEKGAWCVHTRNVLVTSSYRPGVEQSLICSSLTEAVSGLCGSLSRSVLALLDCALPCGE